jgi:glutamate/aspartate transport system substrate-binding protein
MSALRSIAVLLFLAAAPFAWAQKPQFTESRVALVIGNAAYQKSPLRNPVNDARAIADRLQRLGFTVIRRENLRSKEIGAALREFRSRVSAGGVALFFYAGHGLQVKGVNYLPTVDADIETEEDVPTQSLNVGQVLELMEEGKARVNLVFLDACRDNPFARKFRSISRGLAKVDAASGTLISFATRPGSVAADGEGKNGLYTEHLLKHMEEPGLPIEQVLKRVGASVKLASKGRQEPWTEGLLDGDFYFRTGVVATPTPAATDPAAVELTFWESIRASSNAADYRAYLDQYPDGRFAQLAKNRIDGLKTASIAPAPVAAVSARPSVQLAPDKLEGTLKKVRDSGAITIGHRDASLPFSYYYDSNRQPVGYSIDICHRIVDAIKGAIGIASIDVRYQLVTSANRIPLVTNGTVDLECGSTTNNLARQQEVAFSLTYWVTANRFASRRNQNFRTFEDLRGSTVVSTAGTTNLKQIYDLNSQRNLGLTIVPARNHVEAFQMLELGRAAAFVMDDILLHGLIAQTRNPGEWAVSNEALSAEPYAVMVRKGDPQFKAFVDSVIGDIYKTGDIRTIYRKWFEQPVPPRGISLNIPVSAQLNRVFANPTDSGEPSAYR